MGVFRRKWISTMMSVSSHGWKKAFLMLLKVMSTFWPFEELKRKPLEWHSRTPIVFLPVIAGLTIKSWSYGIFLSRALMSSSCAKCASSSFASAGRTSCDSFYLIRRIASLILLWTSVRFLLLSDFRVSSLIKIAFWPSIGGIITSFEAAAFCGLCKLILRKVRFFSYLIEVFLIIRIWKTA